MARLSSLICADKEFSAFSELLDKSLSLGGAPAAVINGLSGGAVNAFITEAVFAARKRAVSLVLASTDDECRSICRQLLKEGVKASCYLGREFIFDSISASHDTERERLSVLYKLIQGEVECVVSTPAAAVSRTMPADMLVALCERLSVGKEISITSLTKTLLLLGYALTDTVEGVGQFSHRGGIVDFFPADFDLPIRVEFFGDEIDRIAHFDVISQRTTAIITEELLLLPAREVIATEKARSDLLNELSRLGNTADELTAQKLSAEYSAIDSGRTLDISDKYIGIVYPKFENLLTVIESCTVNMTLLVGTSACLENAKSFITSVEDGAELLVKSGAIAKRYSKFAYSKDEYADFISSHGFAVHVNSFSGGVGNIRTSGIFGFRCRKNVSFGGNMTMLKEELLNYQRGMYRILILADNAEGVKSLISTLYDDGIMASAVSLDKFDITAAAGGSIFVAVGDSEGYDLITPRIAVVSMKEDTGYRQMSKRRSQRILKKVGGAGQRLMSYADLSVGDYVVHANYGIGLFEGIQTVTTLGVTRDYITIRYAGTDKLFVPCDRLEMIGKYIGARDSSGGVKLSKMGGGDWTRAKSKAKSAARDIAESLIKLYAERQRLPGFAFPADSDMEEQFAASFEYAETESQLLAIEEIKNDMMRPVPMNRLLCGDVGFGKTEVALRAAFKAIMGGKQVAILVPTTILALQHFQTATSRMRAYPVTVEMLSGLKSRTEQERILRAVKRGNVDILIGTHKLLSKNLEFRNLGLLVIDEEQRFGVAQKEKLRQMAKNVDTLTLSATPIPRTLNMAMNGICDMSVLDEAPGERRPVQTYVLEHDETVIYEAIRREISRGGQVLYLYNKVEDILLVCGRIARDFPNARVGVAHGQMERDELEDIWQSLVRHEIDILVCTTIIETGVDLPSANTLIIENADRFGLSQLHQIRGRVGRSERQAYAYLTYRRGKVLSEVAEKRLRAIREFAEFGAGFKVALRDLEIRGAGNLLGAEQHGYIESVGYDLYVKLLSEAVLDLKGENIAPAPTATVDISVSANIPESYIRSSSQRMEMYKKISLIKSCEDMSDVSDELIDRFGDMPKATERLLDVALIKALSEELGISKVSFADSALTFRLIEPDFALFASLIPSFAGLMLRASPPSVIYKLKRSDEPTKAARNLLESCLKIKADSKENKDE